MPFVHLILDQQDPPEYGGGKDEVGYTSLEAFRSAGISASGFMVDTRDVQRAEATVQALRTDPATCLLPVFLARDLGPRLGELCDGIPSDHQDRNAHLQRVRHRMQKLAPDVERQGQDFRLLAFLYCRPEELLAPIEDWQHRAIYTYPLAEAMADEGRRAGAWLKQLVERRYLEPERLVGRVRHCPACEACHHNYVDICPHCTSMAIESKPFLHCFTCGHVAPEEAFIKEGLLACPHCRARLRHIGADYDRPMDNYLCRDCGQSCVEPHVVAQCLGCGTRNEPDKLIPEDIHALRLSERGRAAARTGSLEDIYALLDNLNYVRTPYFESLVDWLHGLCRRYNEELFSLLGIRLKNIETLTDRLGRHRTAELIDAFAVRLRESIRLTDLTTRSSKRNLWILLPKTGAVGRDILKSRIVELKAHTRQAEDVALDFDIAAYTAPDDMLPDEPARLTMARIMGGSA
jgi:hypothetical protein